MSVHFMRDNHTFARLDHLPIDDAISRVAVLTQDENGYGFVGCKPPHGDEVFQWRPGEPWRDEVMRILQEAAEVSDEG